MRKIEYKSMCVYIYHRHRHCHYVAYYYIYWKVDFIVGG
jgi:hypothetical protein